MFKGHQSRFLEQLPVGRNELIVRHPTPVESALVLEQPTVVPGTPKTTEKLFLQKRRPGLGVLDEILAQEQVVR